MAVTCIRNAFGHYYSNSSVIVDLSMGQIPLYHVPQNVTTFHRMYF